jgi:uncharacterized membrane protein YgdD (TMEM256/DUF423 family)
LKIFLTLGGTCAFLGVALGAFGAHVLEGRLSAEQMAWYNTGLQYHLFHALGLLAVGLLGGRRAASSALRWSGWLMFAGIVIFSGSLYALSLGGVRWLGAITPIGGTSFLVAWVLFVIAAVRGPCGEAPPGP